MKKFKKFIRVWFLVAKMAAQDQLTTNWGGALFIIGKVVRFLFFFLFLFSVLGSSGTLADLSRRQVVLFFLIFNLVDITTQFLFRGIYVFRPRVVKGEFDLDLVKPLPSFFRPLFGWTDILDFITLLPLSVYIVYYLMVNFPNISWYSLFLFILLFVNAVLISFAIHLLVASVGVITTEVDHLIWIWRDLFNMARVPTDIYPQGMRLVLTFLVPVVIVITVPGRVLMGIISWPVVLVSFLMGIVFVFLSLCFWQFALKQYSSASS